MDWCFRFIVLSVAACLLVDWCFRFNVLSVAACLLVDWCFRFNVLSVAACLLVDWCFRFNVRVLRHVYSWTGVSGLMSESRGMSTRGLVFQV